jgi:Biopolymer transport protein ExbD/TolR
MLVLLVIFMVAAPLSTVALPVDLPAPTATPIKKRDKPIYVTIKSDLEVAVDEAVVKRIDLVSPHFPSCGPGVPYDELMSFGSGDGGKHVGRHGAERYARKQPMSKSLASVIGAHEKARKSKFGVRGGYLKTALVALEGVREPATQALLAPVSPKP